MSTWSKDRKQFHERLVELKSYVAVLMNGGNGEVEVNEKNYRMKYLIKFRFRNGKALWNQKRENSAEFCRRSLKAKELMFALLFACQKRGKKNVVNFKEELGEEFDETKNSFR